MHLSSGIANILSARLTPESASATAPGFGLLPIWLTGAIVSEDCNICDHTFIEGWVRIGNRLTTKCGVSLRLGVVVEDDLLVGRSVVFTNDKWPRNQK